MGHGFYLPHPLDGNMVQRATHRCCEEIVVFILDHVAILSPKDRSLVSLDLCVLLVHIDVLSSDGVHHQSSALKVEVLVSFDFWTSRYFG